MGLFDETDYQELLGSIIKIGEVSSVDAAAGTASVVFDDDDSIVVPDLQVIHRNTFANRDYGMPDIGEDVVCLFLPSGTEEGFILGSVYAGEIEPPADTIDKRVVEFSDGARVAYDRAAHELTVEIDNTVVKLDAENVSIETSKNVVVKGDSAELSCQQKVEISVGGTTATLQGASASIESPSITLKGNITLDGAVTATNSITAAGAVTAASVTASGALTVSGSATIAGDLKLPAPPLVAGVPMIVP